MMAIKTIWLDGNNVLFYSSGNTVENFWLDGDNVSLHEYVITPPTEFTHDLIGLTNDHIKSFSGITYDHLNKAIGI